jgi:hypothetical protein
MLLIVVCRSFFYLVPVLRLMCSVYFQDRLSLIHGSDEVMNEEILGLS